MLAEGLGFLRSLREAVLLRSNSECHAQQDFGLIEIFFRALSCTSVHYSRVVSEDEVGHASLLQ